MRRRARIRGGDGRRSLITVLLPVLLLLAACTNDDPKTPWVQPDRGVVLDGNVPFLGACSQDSDCFFGKCLTVGSSKKCSRPCSDDSPCPALTGWTCNQGFCACSGTGKQPTVCKVDGDCDGEPDRPITVETCNGVDDDCNEKIDDVPSGTDGAKLYFRDADGDGHGDLATSRWICGSESGWVTSTDDCDDTRKDAYPGAPEQCGDGVDHDCDGSKEDADVCGLTPIVVTSVNDPQSMSGTMKTCGATSGLDPRLDITEIVAKQDATAVKFTIRLAGVPALDSCASYTLHLGTLAKDDELVYIYRPAITACAGLPETEVYKKGGQPMSSTAVMAFNAGSPGHVSFVLPKAEYFPLVPSPSYYLRACTNAKADAAKDLTDCASDSCETPVHR